MSQAEQPQDLEETPPGDARDPARAEVGPGAPDAPSAERPGEPAVDPSGSDRPDDPQAQEPAGPSAIGGASDPPDQLAPEEPDDRPALDGVPDPHAHVDQLAPEDPPAIRPRGENEARGHVIRTVDFSQPTKFTADLRRRILRALGSFCEAFALRLSTELRAPVELAVADSSQLTWAAAKAQLPANTIAVALEVQPIKGRMLLCVTPPLLLQALECLLGGQPSQAPSERRFSEVDWALTHRLLQSMIAQLGPAWRDLGGLQLSLGEVDLEGDAGVVVPPGEPTFALTLESRIDSLPSSMTLLIPWSAIGPVVDQILGDGVGGRRSLDTDSREARAMRRGLAGAHVCLRAEVGSLELPVERVLALTPGTLLALQDRAEAGVQLFAEGVPLGRCRPGLRGARRAVKLTEAVAEAGGRAGGLPSNPLQPLLAPASHAAPHPDRDAAEQAGPTRESLARMLDVSVRVWAELGRATLPLGQALELPAGAVVELDQGADSPIELFVNGTRFAHGTLQVGTEGEWAVQVARLV
jgi:flagellar motor switch protein FliM